MFEKTRLKHFGTEAACAAAHTKLIDWATKHNAEMAQADFVAWMDNYMGKVAAQGYIEVIPTNAAHLKLILGKLALPLKDSATLEKVHIALPRLLKRALLQAGPENTLIHVTILALQVTAYM